MAENNRVEDVERVEVPPSGGENVDSPEGAESEDGASEGEEGGAEARQPKEGLVRRPASIEKKPDSEEGEEEGEGAPASAAAPAPVDGETPRERALREEVNRLRINKRQDEARNLRAGEPVPNIQKKELSAEQKALLAKYKPAEIAAMREVLPVLAEDLGFVRKEQLTAEKYWEAADSIFDDFLEKHPEYSEEKDKDRILYERLRTELKFYRQPEDPKIYRKILAKIHTDIFGIKPIGDNGAINAAQRKISVASHAGASAPTRQVVSTRPKNNTTGIRLDMLKGFSEQEKADMVGGGE